MIQQRYPADAGLTGLELVILSLCLSALLLSCWRIGMAGTLQIGHGHFPDVL
jgi:hypothetical protein